MLLPDQPVFIFLFGTLENLIFSLIAAGIFISVGGLITIIKYLTAGANAERVAIEPLFVWHYSAAEWQKYAALYDLAKFPKGAARVQLTLSDVWIIDDENVRQTNLDAERKCVTACRFENQILKIRVRSWGIPTRFGNVVYNVQDINLPIPIGCEREANEVVKIFNENLARMSKKVASVMPDNFSNGLISETNF